MDSPNKDYGTAVLHDNVLILFTFAGFRKEYLLQDAVRQD